VEKTIFYSVTTEAWIPSQTSSSGICHGHLGSGTDFSFVGFWFFTCWHYSTSAPY